MVIKAKPAIQPIKGLSFISISLDPTMDLDNYREHGLDAGALVSLPDGSGGPHLMLGPGTTMRVRPMLIRGNADTVQIACASCWNIKAVFIKGAVRSTPALLCKNLNEEDELFFYCECPLTARRDLIIH
jgi:hypothetical protein